MPNTPPVFINEQKQKYCYLVEHERYGTKVFYDAYDADKSAKLAVDYAENCHMVFKVPLHDSPIETIEVEDLSAQFGAITKAQVDLPDISALLETAG